MVAKQTLSRARILSTAFELVEEESLDGLSMRRLADRLEVAPMSLYNYIPNKDALLDGLVEEMLNEVDLPPPADPSPKFRLKAVALALRAAAQRHPEVFRIVALRPPPPPLLEVLEFEISNLLSLGFERESATAALRISLGYVFGYTRLETGGFFPALGKMEDMAAIADDFPEVAESSEYLSAWDHDEEFERGLDALLSGLGSHDA